MIADLSTRNAWRGLPDAVQTAADMLASASAEPGLQAELLAALKKILGPAAYAAVERRAAEIMAR
jgi:hypothetical protein